jgi:hypothetical protein
LHGVIVVSLLVVFAIDCMTRTDIHLTVFYLAPIFLASWYLSAPAGWVTALLCAAAWQFADCYSRRLPIESALSAWNTAVIGGVFLANAISATQLKENLARQRKTEEELRQALSAIDALKARPSICGKCSKPLDPP